MGESAANRGPFTEAHDLRDVEHVVARILAETDRPVEAYSAVLEALGGALGGRFGAVWELDSAAEVLRCARTWQRDVSEAPLQTLSESITLAPGQGLPGRVLLSGLPAWLADAPTDRNFPRAEAARRSGVHAGFAFPLRSARGVVGVMEFFGAERRAPDPALLATMSAIGSLVGQFVARRRAEEEVRARESRLRAMLDAALDAVVTMDAKGRIIGWNPAAEATFGYPAADALGREMAELIVPPDLRDAHRRGLARFLEHREGVMLDRRIEIRGMRSDGSEFPVELTITHIALPGSPTFTGYLRDIGERVRSEQELRASRARLVEVADAERRRIQRNLHDGAQQRLTSVLLTLGRVRAGAGDANPLLEFAVDELAAGLDELRELASGLHPALLTERGLVTALEALAMRSPVPVELELVPERRLPEQIEAAAYYVVAEALANVHKHAGASRVVVRVAADPTQVEVSVADDGAGGADEEGSGLRGLADRVESLGGTLRLASPAGGGTTLRARIPFSSTADTLATC